MVDIGPCTTMNRAATTSSHGAADDCSLRRRARAAAPRGTATAAAAATTPRRRRRRRHGAGLAVRTCLVALAVWAVARPGPLVDSYVGGSSRCRRSPRFSPASSTVSAPMTTIHTSSQRRGSGHGGGSTDPSSFTPPFSSTQLHMSPPRASASSIPSASSTKSRSTSSCGSSMGTGGGEGDDGSDGGEASKKEDSFELHVGRALDTLRRDYPRILTTNPDLSIYADDIECVDPAHVKLHGLRNYKAALDVLHAVVNIVYCPSKSSLTFRLCYDAARRNIRVHWHAEIVPREIFGGGGGLAAHHVSGISVYEFSADVEQVGLIAQHRIEQLLYNDRPVVPEGGVLALLRRQSGQSVTVPSFIQDSTNTHGGDSATNIGAAVLAEFRTSPNNNNYNSNKNHGGSLFAMEAGHRTGDEDGAAATSTPPPPPPPLDIDWAELERKNKSRLKFGLAPLSPVEFLELQGAVRQLAAAQEEQRATTSAQANAAAKKQAAEQKQQQQQKSTFLDKLFGGVLTDTCESNFDCDRPLVCCDFGVTKKCCSAGSLVPSNNAAAGGLRYARIPVYAGSEPGRRNPRGDEPQAF